MAIVRPDKSEVEVAAYFCHKSGGARHGHALKDWLQGEQLVFMAKNYRMVANHMLVSPRPEKLWNKEPRQCRYCGAVKPKDRGWKVAHALPELVGNKSIIALDECTKCNDHFAKHLEEDLGKFLNLAKSITRIRGKVGVPSFKASKGKSRIDVEGDTFHVQQHEGDPFATFDPVAKTLTLKASSQPLVPSAVYKALTKMAVAIMPPALLPKLQHTIHWLMTADHKVHAADVAASARCCFQFQPGPFPPDYGWCAVLERLSAKAVLPHFIFVLTIANQSFQIMVPCVPDDNHLVGQRVPLPQNPAFYGYGYEFGEWTSRTLDLASPVRRSITVSGEFAADAVSSSPES